MLTFTTVLAVSVLPTVGLTVLLLAVGRVERAREARIIRQWAAR